MKHFSQLFSLVILLVFTGCTKDQSLINPEKINSSQFDSLVTFLKVNFPDKTATLNLESIKTLRYDEQILGYKIFEKSNKKIFLLVKKYATTYSGNWVDLTGLNKNQSNKYSGKIQLKKLGDDTHKDLIIENNRVIKVEKWNKTLSRKIVINPLRKGISPPHEIFKIESPTMNQAIIARPEIIVEVNYVSYWNLFWLFEELVPYSNFYIGEDFDNSGGGGNGNYSQSTPNENVIVMPVYEGPKHPISDLKTELKCLTINPNSTYSITINVNQPRPNARDKVNPSNDFMAGHAFLTLEQNNPDGTKIVRNVGFYPKNSVYPGNYEDQSIFGEDSETPFAVSLKITVTGQEMNTVVNSLIAQQSLAYDLENSNCVSSVALSFQKINIQLPMTSSGIEYLFKGVNPGDFGQDIRNLDLNKFREENGNRNVERITSEKNALQPSGKKGSC